MLDSAIDDAVAGQWLASERSVALFVPVRPDHALSALVALGTAPGRQPVAADLEAEHWSSVAVVLEPDQSFVVVGAATAGAVAAGQVVKRERVALDSAVLETAAMLAACLVEVSLAVAGLGLERDLEADSAAQILAVGCLQWVRLDLLVALRPVDAFVTAVHADPVASGEVQDLQRPACSSCWHSASVGVGIEHCSAC